MGPADFQRRFGRPCEVIARAPGRVNLIGDHTDYNGGFVLPIATEHCTRVSAARRDDDRMCAFSESLGTSAEWPLEDWSAERHSAWTSYAAGVALLLKQRGARLAGCDLYIQGDIPLGRGLSSSASLSVAVAKALTCLSGEALDFIDIADLCREAEHQFAGVPCGIMDPLACLLGRRDTAMLLDCRSRSVEHIPLDFTDHVIVVIDSGVRRALAKSAYAERVAECARAVTHFQRLNPAVRALRDVTVETARAQMLQMPPVVAARAFHVVSENRRVLAAAEALRRRDLAAFGPLLEASHRSLRDDYEVSCPELDAIVETLTGLDGVIGCRMTGAGFGGSAVALVHRSAIDAVRQALEYGAARRGMAPWEVFLTRADDGATIEFA